MLASWKKELKAVCGGRERDRTRGREEIVCENIVRT